MTSDGIVTSFPDPEEHDVPLPESSCEAALALDGLRLSCFVSSLEALQNIIHSFWFRQEPSHFVCLSVRPAQSALGHSIFIFQPQILHLDFMMTS